MIDLSKEAPRSGREMLGGFAWLARMADKAKAKGTGTLGEYISLCPMDEGFLLRSGVTEDAFVGLISSGADDEEVASYFERNVGTAQRDAANEWILVEMSDHVDEMDEEEGRALQRP
jgi:Domain of unknown function (DUF5069)